MHKSIKIFAENEGSYDAFLFLHSKIIFSAKFIRFAQLYDSEITDIRGFFISIHLFVQ